MDGSGYRSEAAVPLVKHEGRQNSEWRAAAFSGADQDARRCSLGMPMHRANRDLGKFRAQRRQHFSQRVGPENGDQNPFRPEQEMGGIDPAGERALFCHMRQGAATIG